jgi:hypothetical protein
MSAEDQKSASEKGPEKGVKETAEWLSSRVAELETEASRLRRTGRILIVAAVVFALLIAAGVYREIVLFGQAFTKGPIVEARGFALVDDNGTRRGEWTASEDGSQFHLMDDREEVRARMSVTVDGAPGMTFLDEEGRTRVVVGFLPDGTGTLVFADELGVARLVLGLASDGSANLVFADPGGLTRAVMGVDAVGQATLIVPGEAEEESDPSEDDEPEEN